LTAQEAEKLLLGDGFNLIRSKGSHRIYFKDGIRVVIPFHSGKILHPKIVKQVVEAIGMEEDED
jgi:predicted RNA binding protein YcfA (HicA-like mRNA interferase family)